MNVFRGLVILLVLAAACVLAGCDAPKSDAEFNRLPVVMSGSGPWGSVDLRKAPGDIVRGDLPWGGATMHRNGNQYSGDTPWGQTSLTYVDGLLSGSAPWGTISVRVSETELTGTLPWGDAKLTLQGQKITGSLPWGSVELTLGDGYHALNDPDVLLALAALLSDKT